MMTVESRAISSREPCQVRKEAAVSKISYVPEDSLTRAGCPRNVWRLVINAGCVIKYVLIF